VAAWLFVVVKEEAENQRNPTSDEAAMVGFGWCEICARVYSDHALSLFAVSGKNVNFSPPRPSYSMVLFLSKPFYRFVLVLGADY
jgi:hypothetical protein